MIVAPNSSEINPSPNCKTDVETLPPGVFVGKNGGLEVRLCGTINLRPAGRVRRAAKPIEPVKPVKRAPAPIRPRPRAIHRRAAAPTPARRASRPSSCHGYTAPDSDGEPPRPHITAERLREALRYDPSSGLFTWLIATNRCIRIGAGAGCPNNKGYRQIRIDGRLYYASRLAVLWMTGAFPPADIDHANLDCADDRWSNLREATRQQNVANTRARSNNKSGFKGVSLEKRQRRWRAKIQVNAKGINLGSFDCPAAAALAYIVAADKHFGEFARAK